MADEPDDKKVTEVSDATIARLVHAVELAYNRPWRMMGRSFIHGLMTALGATVGTALFFTILLWIFQALGGLDLIKPGVEKLQSYIIPKEILNQINPSTTPSPTASPY
jgi:hypothetical protein